MPAVRAPLPVSLFAKAASIMAHDHGPFRLEVVAEASLFGNAPLQWICQVRLAGSLVHSSDAYGTETDAERHGEIWIRQQQLTEPPAHERAVSSGTDSALVIPARYLFDAERRVVKQRELVSILRRDGHDTDRGQRLLETMEDTLVVMRKTADLIRTIQKAAGG